MASGLVVRVIGDTRGFETSMARAARSTEATAGKMERVGKVAGVAALAIGGGLALGLEKSVKAAMDAQVSQARLEQAFKTAGLSSKDYSGALDKAEAASRNLGFAGNQTREALGSLVVATHSVSKSVKDLAIAEDLARFKHIGLAEATKMITSASAGNARAIKQLGILLVPLTDHVDALRNANVKATTAAGRLEYAHAKLKDKMETAAHAVDLVREKVQGQGEAYAKTAAGSMQVFHEKLQFLEVTLGQMLLPAITKVTDKLAALAGFLAKHKTLAEALAIGVAAFAFALGGLSIASTIAAAGMSAFWIAATGGLILAIPLIAAGVIEIVKHFDTIKKALGKVVDAFMFVKNWVADHWKEIATLISGPFAPVVALATNAFGVRSTLVNAFTAIKRDVSTAVDAVAAFITGLPGRIGDFSVKLASTFTGYFTGAGLGGWVSGKVGEFAAFITGLPGRIGNFGVKLFNTVTGFFANAGVGGWIDGLISRWAGLFTSLPGKIGAAILAGAKDLKDAVTGLFGKVIGWVKDVLGISSPSSVFMDIGKNVIQGFVKGVGGMAGVLKDAVVRMVSSLPSRAVGAVTGAFSGGSSGPTSSGIPTAPGVDLKDTLPRVRAALQYAMSHGWHGEVTSGYRSYAEQARLYDNFLHHGGPLAAKPGSSSHESGSAVDVSDYGTFGRIMANAPDFERLFNHLGAKDPVHFSISGYDKGGWLMPGVTMAVNKTGKPEMVIPAGQIGGGVVNNWNFPNYVGSKQELVETVKRELYREQKRNTTLGFK